MGEDLLAATEAVQSDFNRQSLQLRQLRHDVARHAADERAARELREEHKRMCGLVRRACEDNNEEVRLNMVVAHQQRQMVASEAEIGGLRTSLKALGERMQREVDTLSEELQRTREDLRRQLREQRKLAEEVLDSQVSRVTSDCNAELARTKAVHAAEVHDLREQLVCARAACSESVGESVLREQLEEAKARELDLMEQHRQVESDLRDQVATLEEQLRAKDELLHQQQQQFQQQLHQQQRQHQLQLTTMMMQKSRAAAEPPQPPQQQQHTSQHNKSSSSGSGGGGLVGLGGGSYSPPGSGSKRGSNGNNNGAAGGGGAGGAKPSAVAKKMRLSFRQ